MIPSNAKIHSQEHIDKIVKSIKEFGFKQPILITTDNFIIAGHGRYAAGEKLLLSLLCNILMGAHDEPPSLQELGIEKIQLQRWQNIASIPEEVFEDHIKEVLEAILKRKLYFWSLWSL